jgi:glycosyltransferase involved in cell wall biosynthesis
MTGPLAAAAPGPARRAPRVAYVMSRFPKLTETFILNEMVAVEAAGATIELFPLLREREARMHPEAVPWVARAHYLPFLSPAIVASHVALFLAGPGRYLRALGAMLRGTAGSVNLLVGGLGIFPKVGHAARLMQAAGVEHVHCHFATHPALAGFLIHRLVGIPYSFTAHGSDIHVDRHMLCEKVAEAAFVVTVSEFNRGVISRECGGRVSNLDVLRCGVDTSVFRPVAAGGSPGTFRILSVGTLHEVKGQAHLLRALARLEPGGPPVRCRIVGEGPDRAALERLVTTLGLGERVELLGGRSRLEVADLMRDSDVLVAPSVPTRAGKREGLPVVVIEALASGLPVVASDLSGIPEIVEDGVTGFLTPPGDDAAIAAALERLRRDPALGRRLGDAGRDRVLEEYDQARGAAWLVDRFARSVA